MTHVKKTSMLAELIASSGLVGGDVKSVNLKEPSLLRSHSYGSTSSSTGGNTGDKPVLYHYVSSVGPSRGNSRGSVDGGNSSSSIGYAGLKDAGRAISPHPQQQRQQLRQHQYQHQQQFQQFQLQQQQQLLLQQQQSQQLLQQQSQPQLPNPRPLSATSPALPRSNSQGANRSSSSLAMRTQPELSPNPSRIMEPPLAIEGSAAAPSVYSPPASPVKRTHSPPPTSPPAWGSPGYIPVDPWGPGQPASSAHSIRYGENDVIWATAMIPRTAVLDDEAARAAKAAVQLPQLHLQQLQLQLPLPPQAQLQQKLQKEKDLLHGGGPSGNNILGGASSNSINQPAARNQRSSPQLPATRPLSGTSRAGTCNSQPTHGGSSIHHDHGWELGDSHEEGGMLGPWDRSPTTGIEQDLSSFTAMLTEELSEGQLMAINSEMMTPEPPPTVRCNSRHGKHSERLSSTAVAAVMATPVHAQARTSSNSPSRHSESGAAFKPYVPVPAAVHAAALYAEAGAAAAAAAAAAGISGVAAQVAGKQLPLAQPAEVPPYGVEQAWGRRTDRVLRSTSLGSSPSSPTPPAASTAPNTRRQTSNNLGMPPRSSLSSLTSTAAAVAAATAAAASAVAAAGSATEGPVHQLQLTVEQLTLQVNHLQQCLASHESVANEVQGRATTAAADREAEHEEAARRHMKSLKSAESVRDKAELSRHTADKRARGAEEEVMLLRGMLQQKGGALEDARAALVAADIVADVAKKGADEALLVVKAEWLAIAARAKSESSLESSSLRDSLDKARTDLARRTLTIHNLQTDLEGTAEREQTLQLSLDAAHSQLQQLQQQSQLALHLHELQLQQVEKAGQVQLVSALSGMEVSASLSAAAAAAAAVAGAADGEVAASLAGRPRGQPQQYLRQRSLSSMSSSFLRVSSGGGSGGDRSSGGGAGPQQRSSVSGGGMGRGSSSGGSALQGEDLGRVTRRLQTELAEAREEYARRLVALEGVAIAAESSAKEAVAGLDATFTALISRTAQLLAGRLPGMSGGSAFTPTIPANANSFPSRPSVSSSSSRASQPLSGSSSTTFTFASLLSGGPVRPPTPSLHANSTSNSNSASNANTTTTAVLSAMNDKLSSENAVLLAELARFHSGKHAMLRRMGMTTVGTGSGNHNHSTNSNSGGVVTGGNNAGNSPSPNSASLQPTASSTGVIVFGNLAFTLPASAGSNGAVAVAGGANASSNSTVTAYQNGNGSAAVHVPPTAAVTTAAREALSAAVKETLLCSRRELLPAVMTAEGWGDFQALGHNAGSHVSLLSPPSSVRSETALSAAEASVRLRAQVIALTADIAVQRAEAFSELTVWQARGATVAGQEATTRELRRDLALARQTVAGLQRSLEDQRTSNSSNLGGGSGTGSGIWTGGENTETGEGDSELRVALKGARDEVGRQKLLVAAVKKERDGKSKTLDDLESKHMRLESTLRELRTDSTRHDEGMKRLRALLAQAKVLLRESGVSFLEEEFAFETKGNSGRLLGSDTGEGSLFRATEARDREKEAQRLRSETTEAQHEAALAGKEIKKLKAQLGKATLRADSSDAESAAAMSRYATSSETAKKLGQERVTVLSEQLQERDNECRELGRRCSDMGETLTKLKIDADYLRGRAASSKIKPKLSFAKVLSVSLEPGSMVGSS